MKLNFSASRSCHFKNMQDSLYKPVFRLKVLPFGLCFFSDSSLKRTRNKCSFLVRAAGERIRGRTSMAVENHERSVLKEIQSSLQGFESRRVNTWS